MMTQAENPRNATTRVQHERHRLEQHLSEAYRFLAENPWKSIQAWFVAAVEHPAGRRWLSELLEFPRGMDGGMLQQLFGSDCAFSKTSLALAARRLFYLLRPFRELACSPYAPSGWAELVPALTGLLDSCHPFTLARPLTWSHLWRMVGPAEVGKPNPLHTVNLESYITFALDGREFTILEVIYTWRHSAVAGTDEWDRRRNLIMNWITDLLKRRHKDGASPPPADRLMLETAWWAIETGVWLSSRSDTFPEGRPNLPDWARPALIAAIKESQALLVQLREIGRPDVSPPPDDAQYKVRLASTPEVFSPDRSLLFAGKNAMRLATRLRCQLWLKPENGDLAALLRELDQLVAAACDRIIGLRDNGHLWWAQQRLSFLYDWTDYNRLRNIIEALKGKGSGPGYTLSCFQKRGKWLLAPEIAETVDQIVAAIRMPVKSLFSGGEPKNREMSVVLLAGPGTGKSTLVQSIVEALAKEPGVQIDANYNERKLQHLPTQDAFRAWLESSTRLRAKVAKGEASVPVTFLDELHLTLPECNQYAEMLPCLEDNAVLVAQQHGYKVETDRVAVFVFATSRYEDKWAFARDAEVQRNQAMIDFHSRVARWQSILPLEYMPLQRVAIYCGSKPTSVRAGDVIWIATTKDPEFATGRGVSNAAKVASELRSRIDRELEVRFGLENDGIAGDVSVESEQRIAGAST